MTKAFVISSSRWGGLYNVAEKSLGILYGDVVVVVVVYFLQPTGWIIHKTGRWMKQNKTM